MMNFSDCCSGSVMNREAVLCCPQTLEKRSTLVLTKSCLLRMSHLHNHFVLSIVLFRFSVFSICFCYSLFFLLHFLIPFPLCIVVFPLSGKCFATQRLASVASAVPSSSSLLECIIFTGSTAGESPFSPLQGSCGEQVLHWCSLMMGLLFIAL